MTVRAGREFLAIPGPTTSDEVLRAMHRPAVDMYSPPLIALTDSLAGLRAVRDGWLEGRRRHVGISEGTDDTAWAWLRRRQRSRPRGTPQS